MGVLPTRDSEKKRAKQLRRGKPPRCVEASQAATADIDINIEPRACSSRHSIILLPFKKTEKHLQRKRSSS
jgi:hypothetical protein